MLRVTAVRRCITVGESVLKARVARQTRLGFHLISSRGTHRTAPPASASCQDVTLPVIPELYDANFLDTLLPKRDVLVEPKVDVEEPRHPMMDALKAAANRTHTQNRDPAYKSTGSPTLDAFQWLRPGYFQPSLRGILDRAWAEDPELTLRIIWNSRSIHDGKSAKEIFYQ